MKTLIFIYKAKSDKLSKIIDFAHKIVSPSTYACDLCSLTYGDFSIKKDWKDYLDNLNQQWIQTEFYYEDRAADYGLNRDDLPAIFYRADDKQDCIISWVKFEKMKSITDLEQVINSYLC